ncbi:class I tRNA ligase family protein [Actinoplanes sp. NPDC051494]|uniref:class I tRNA ligase family protein n=1 Tax=Actinoplanes sp. NPDC051494 TaxID=3363907 RepID=UPI0037A3F73D
MTTIVSGSPPTPNGDLHLGHLSGPYSGADILARARRLTGEESIYLVGSDIHQSYVPEKARERRVDAMALATSFDDEISRLFTTMGFSNAGYVRPRESDLHAAAVADFIGVLHASGKLEERTEDCLYCAPCDRYLFEAHVTGTCPFCGDDDCDANLCEKCAWPNVGTDLLEPRCNHCGTPPVLRPFTRLIFPLSRYADRLRGYHRTVVMSPQLESLAGELLEHGLPDIAVSHVTDWGVPVPVDGFPGQCVYVWAEMVPGYFAELAEALRAAGRDPGDWRRVWDEARVVQFFGWDNGYFHTLLFPALMMAYDPGLRLPAAWCANEFFLLDDEKFSTSREHAIWGSELLELVPADVVRFALAHDRPQFRRTNFTLRRFHDLVDGVLAGRWQGWLAGLFTALEEQAGGRIPGAAPTTAQRLFVAGLGTIAADGLAAYTVEQFSPRRAARTLRELVERATDFADGQSRLRRRAPGSPAALAGLAAEAQAAKLLAQLAAPIMPGFAQRLWTALGCTGAPVWDDLAPLRAGTPYGTDRQFFLPLPPDLASRLGRDTR